MIGLSYMNDPYKLSTSSYNNLIIKILKIWYFRAIISENQHMMH